MSTTLVAVATPPGRGGIGCVRVSGPEARGIAGRLFRSAGAKPVAGRVRFGRFLARDGQPLDHGYLVEFTPGGSFTGERTVELWSHGSPAVLSELVEAAVAAGAVPAAPGEFTYRALRNGRLDLARAEAVKDLVDARTLYQARVAFAQADGALSRRLAPLREELTEWIARGEAAVEFVDESETHLAPGELLQAIAGARASCRQLLAGFEAGRVVREGATLAMIGLPNVGKSSLFNRLLDRERAIVSEAAGTTRDTLEDELNLDGVPLRLIDTAGLREVDDPVEIEGVRRAERAREEADLVLLVLDRSRPLEPLEREALERGHSPKPDARTVVVLNKCDLEDRAGTLPEGTSPVRVSAATGDGVDGLRDLLRRRLLHGTEIEQTLITNSRHAHALSQALDSLGRAETAGNDGLPEELVLEDLRDAMRGLGAITGEFTTEDLYDRIFSTFCIGK